ncbi:hypothetical protein LEMA_P003580.1 [Plenodomus lingam JN3]|uniref:Thymidylate kinase n=1 Tax=Leptosphaeria maculans (strain JN3 / isolate v23.1.3 / race Av1-4-5-6-7-8) TaxID=985895 RepID=E5AED2_LEPMJ|nr:hypothetical protein LEMA_P003580.1 [Plenodomus lingam JN3]CBY01571.1 hypothetical protein LEMA_P003580.1 [Plenodomus lingam JN3]
MTTFTRQPFGELGSSRLQALQSAKNKQNAISPSFASPLKPSPTAATGKRQRAPEIFQDDSSSENIDPALFGSPAKKSRTFSHAGFIKPAKPSLFLSPAKAHSSSTPSSSSSLTATPTIPSIRNALSSPNTARSTPISTSRGSPKNKRIHAISKRRASSSPYRRLDPPSFSATNTPASNLPFSIDAALSGSIPTYTPKAASVVSTPMSAPQHGHMSNSVEEAMPKSWFFDIHEDTPEQEAANHMEHSASVLDISSDDDVEMKKLNEDLERGKENIPPPEWVVAQQARVQAQTSMSIAGSDKIDAEEPVKRPRLKTFIQDAMEEDRKPLGDLPPSEFYGEGCDASTYVTVDAGMERPSGLSRECDFSVAVDEEDKVDETPVVEPTLLVEEHTANPPASEKIAPGENESHVAVTTCTSQDPVAQTLDTTTPSSPQETSNPDS